MEEVAGGLAFERRVASARQHMVQFLKRARTISARALWDKRFTTSILPASVWRMLPRELGPSSRFAFLEIHALICETFTASIDRATPRYQKGHSNT